MNLVSKCSRINNQVIISSFFIIILLAGLYLSDDYGISIDEPFHRTLGYFWYIQIFEYFSTNTLEIEILKEKYNSMFWSREITGGQYRQYGVIFDLICVFLEESFKITDNKSAFQLKHKFNFLIFFFSSIFFYKIIYFRFQKKIFSLIITFFYLSTPRIFAESFYNPKDIIFMCFCLFSIYFAINILVKQNLINIIFFAFFSALATSTRVLGVLFFFLFLIFIIFMFLEKKTTLKLGLKMIFIYIISYLIFLYIFWPFLWENPIGNIFYAFKSFANYQWEGDVLYLGNFIKATNLPWHYSFTWIYATLPLFVFLFFLFGFIFIFKRFIKKYLDLSDKTFLWETEHELIDYFLLFFFLIPIFAIIFFGSTLYGGWRHLYFLYPTIIYFFAFGIDNFINLMSKKKYNFIFPILFLSLIFNNIFILIKFHPYQNTFFNITLEKKANELFSIDYWGLSNLEALKYLDTIEKNNFSIAVASFTPIVYSKIIYNSKNDIELLGTNKTKADYIFTNYVYEQNPNKIKKYKIPDNYVKIKSVYRGDILINEIYKKK